MQILIVYSIYVLIYNIILGIASIPFMSNSQSASQQIAQQQQSAVSSIQKFKMIFNLYVPRVYSNEKSLGYRKYQYQKIEGLFYLGFDTDGNIVDYMFENFMNKTHKLSNGQNVTYAVQLDPSYYPRFNVVGSNKTNRFKTASICFSMIAELSYIIGEIDEDTSLYIMLAGKGNINESGKISSATGYASGTMGCGCSAYGHRSPTRKIGKYGATDFVDDVASVYGRWRLKAIN